MGAYGGDGMEQIKALFCWHGDLERQPDYSLPPVTVDTFLRGSRLIKEDNIIPPYEAAAYDAVAAGFIDKRYFWMVTLASLCVRDSGEQLERELKDKERYSVLL